MNTKCLNILGRFPEQSKTLTLLIAEEPEFRAICEDYDTCMEALRYWGQSDEPEAKARIREYRNLVEELAKEVVRALAARKGRGADR